MFEEEEAGMEVRSPVVSVSMASATAKSRCPELGTVGGSRPVTILLVTVHVCTYDSKLKSDFYFVFYSIVEKESQHKCLLFSVAFFLCNVRCYMRRSI